MVKTTPNPELEKVAKIISDSYGWVNRTLLDDLDVLLHLDDKDKTVGADDTLAIISSKLWIHYPMRGRCDEVAQKIVDYVSSVMVTSVSGKLAVN